MSPSRSSAAWRSWNALQSRLRRRHVRGTFESPSVVPGTADPTLGFNGSLQGLLMDKLAVNEWGAVAVVNSTFKRDEASHVWLIRGQATGR
jgi:hypothetical protein